MDDAAEDVAASDHSFWLAYLQELWL